MKARGTKLIFYLRDLLWALYRRSAGLSLRDELVEPANAARALDRAFGRETPFLFTVHFWTNSFWTNCLTHEHFRITFKNSEAWMKVIGSGDPDILPAAMVAGEVLVEGSIFAATEALEHFRKSLSDSPLRSAPGKQENRYFPTSPR